MLFSRAVSIQSTLPAAIVRSRLRTRATLHDVTDLAEYRRRQIIGWRLSEAGERFLFQPEYGDALDVEGARLVGLVEPFGAGSRIRGHVTVSPFTRVLASVSMLAITVAMIVGLSQAREPAAKVLGISWLMLGVTVIMVRYSLWSTRRIVESRLRQSLDVAGPRAAA